MNVRQHKALCRAWMGDPLWESSKIGGRGKDVFRELVEEDWPSDIFSLVKVPQCIHTAAVGREGKGTEECRSETKL